MSNCSEPISFETTMRIEEEMKNNICTINLKDKNNTFGFFSRIPFPDDQHPLTILITSSEFISKEFLEKEKELDLLIINEKTNKHINLNDRIKYTNTDYNLSIIEIKEDSDDIHNFFELDENIKNQDTKKLINEKIYILQNFNKKIFFSLGTILDI